MTSRIRRLLAAGLALALVAGIASGCYVFGNGLTGVEWHLTGVHETVPNIQTTIPAGDIGRYTITFASDGTASIKADCNAVAATYTTTPGGGLSIRPGPSTLVACPADSHADQFVAGLSAATSYSVRGIELTMYIGSEGSIELAGAK